MKITGFTIVRNAVKNDYPVVEAIKSILPVVDEMIVSIDKGEDNSEELIKSIASDKIKIVYSQWDMALKEGGRVYAVETDKAKAHAEKDSDWLLYIQADEIIHEKYHDTLKAAALQYKDDKEVEGLLFRYLHFYGTYDYVGDSRSWYNYEIRMIRNDEAISSYKDAQGFRKGSQKLRVALTDVFVYHYGWVKNPKLMMDKRKETVQYYNGNNTESVEQFRASADVFDYNQFDAITKFSGTHPAVMQERIKQKNWEVELDENIKRLRPKDWLLYWIEKKTGTRLFTFKNYKIIRQ